MKNILNLLTDPPDDLPHALSFDACDPAALADAAEALPACSHEADWGIVAEIANALRAAPLPDAAQEALMRLDTLLARRGFPPPPPADELPLA